MSKKVTGRGKKNLTKRSNSLQEKNSVGIFRFVILLTMINKTILFKAKSKKHKYKEDYRNNETKYLENLECVVAISRKINKQKT